MTETQSISSSPINCLSASCSKIGRGFGRAWRAIKQFDRDAVQKLGHGGMGLIWLTLCVALIALFAFGFNYLWTHPNFEFVTMSTLEQTAALSVFLVPLTMATICGTGRLAIGNLLVALCHPRAQSPEVDNPEFSKNSKDEEADL